MAEVSGYENQYLVKPQAARRAIDLLANRRSHNHLPGYLALLRQRMNPNLDGGFSAIEDFFFDYMQVDGAPKNRPFIQPFLSRGKGVRLLNSNLQGSYAPSSIRSGQPLSKVLEVKTHVAAGGAGYEYALLEGHAEKVLSEMLAGNRILAASLSIFLFRDRTVFLEDGSIDGLIDALREFFQIRGEDEDGDIIFSTLFEDDSPNFSVDDFERV